VIEQFVQATIAIVAIANPLGAAPVFLGVTEGVGPAERNRLALRATLAVFVILVASTLVGRPLLSALGISLSAFRAGGGLVILLMGLEMLRGQPTRVQNPGELDEEVEDTVVVPFAMPMVAGPGAITTVITLASGERHGLVVAVIAAIAAMSAVLFVVLRSASWLDQRISQRAQRIFLRFMGLILVAMGVQFLADGALALVHAAG